MSRALAASALAIVVLMASLLLTPSAARAADAPTASEWQGLVRGQIDAFEHDDAAKAYGFASPGIRAVFPSPDIFLGMVRQGYPPVYRPGSVSYGSLEMGASGPMARVYLTDSDGTGWIALYTFERQADGSWKISGCRLLKDSAPTI